VIPASTFSRDDLLQLVAEAEQALAEASRLDSQCWFRHFFFGVLDRDRALQFIRMHNRHHLSIIDDILAARR
jgi:hypothetical protein